jgi:hypothetical protein
MAKKKRTISKSQAVREFFKANPKATNQEVVDAMAKKGIKISPNYVGNIKATHNKKRRAVRKAVAKGDVTLPQLKAALALLKATESIEAARAALAAAQEIREIV